MTDDAIRPVPWDSEVFGIDCFEITHVDAYSLARACKRPGHYTVKIDPLTDKGMLHRHGFYYVDTLIEPVCDDPDRLTHYRHPDCSISTDVAVDMLEPMCRASFLHGRFHRDFNVPSKAADQRYVRWLNQLQREGEIFALLYRRQTAGFIACRQGSLLLHAIRDEFRGKGLAKYFWSAVCEQLFRQGNAPVSSSISAANLPVLNLYSRLGFRFKSAVDVYHGLVR